MTQAEQEAELIQARDYLRGARPSLTVDRCRHESVDRTTLWIFHPAGTQMGCVKQWRESVTRPWEATRMSHGLAVARQDYATMDEALHWIAAYEAHNVYRRNPPGLDQTDTCRA